MHNPTRYYIIVNPISGFGAGERAIPRLQRLLSDHGLEFELARSERPWHAAQLAQDACAAGYDVVVAAGGDGTANEVLNGMMRARQLGDGPGAAMGVLCVGRGNDFAFGVGIPGDLEAGCAALAEGHRRTIDIGRVAGGLYPEGRYFGNGIGIGFDAVVGFETLKMRRLRGAASYLVAALKTILVFYRAPLVRIEYEGQTLTQPSLLVSVMNGRRMGGSFMMGPSARPDDGLLDLCIARQVSRPRIFTLIPSFMKGTQAAQAPITTGRARRLTVVALEGVLPAHADGETLCTDGRELAIELLPQQLEIICSRTQVL